MIDEFSDFQRLIEGCIDLDAAQNNEYQINARFDPEFTQWCEEKEQVKQKIDTIFRAVGNPNPLLGSTNYIYSFVLTLFVGWCAPGPTRTGGGQAGQGQRRARKLEGARVAYRRSEEGTHRTLGHPVGCPYQPFNPFPAGEYDEADQIQAGLERARGYDQSHAGTGNAVSWTLETGTVFSTIDCDV